MPKKSKAKRPAQQPRVMVYLRSPEELSRLRRAAERSQVPGEQGGRYPNLSHFILQSAMREVERVEAETKKKAS